jgi:hypothetical protein
LLDQVLPQFCRLLRGLCAHTLRQRRLKLSIDAQDIRRSSQASKDRGDYIDPRAGKATVARWADKWFGAVHPTLKPKTAASYESLLRSRVLLSLGHRRISKLKPSDVQDWIGKLQADRLSASRIRQAHVVLRQVLDVAVRDGAVARNAALGVKLPKLERREAAFFEPGIVEQIAAEMPVPYDLLTRLLGVSGLRWAEGWPAPAKHRSTSTANIGRNDAQRGSWRVRSHQHKDSRSEKRSTASEPCVRS